MRLFDVPLVKILSQCKLPEWWVICRFCSMPFKTSTFEDTCERCKHLDIYREKYISKVMVRFIIFSTVTALIFSFLVIYLSNYTRNINIILVFLLLAGVVIGGILLRIVNNLKQ